MGKVIGGGLPIAAYGGRRDIMSHIAPRMGPDGLYQAGILLSGNPLAVNAGIAMLRYIQENPGLYAELDAKAQRLADAAPAGMTVNRVGSMFTWFFTDKPVTDYESAKRADTGRFKKFFHAMLERGIYLPPSQFEAAFVSTAHEEADIECTLTAARECF